jgi:rare lipoprotein A
MMRSMVIAAIVLLIAGSTTANASRLRKHGQPNHHQTSSVSDHRAQISVERHRETLTRKARPVPVRRNAAYRATRHRPLSIVPEPARASSEVGPLQPIIDFFQIGVASIWAGGPTSDGKHVRPSDMACAHRTLPLGTVIRVTHERSKRSILVTVRDRGPYKRGKILDLTPAAASALGFDYHAGVARVTLNIVNRSRVRDQVIYD